MALLETFTVLYLVRNDHCYLKIAIEEHETNKTQYEFSNIMPSITLSIFHLSEKIPVERYRSPRSHAIKTITEFSISEER